MIKKKYTILALGIVSILLASLFVTNVLLAKSGGEYDPWIDTNDDGTIDVNDLQSIASIYGTSGEPLNKTALLSDLQARVENLEARTPQLTTTSIAGDTILIGDLEWHDLLNVTLTLHKNASVLAIATTRPVHVFGDIIGVRHRVNNTYGIGRDSRVSAGLLEMHHTWLNLTLGTYTFAFQYSCPVYEEGLTRDSRFTLVIIY